MKLLISGDWHLRGSKPENRLDDYEETQYQKMLWILDKAEESGCEYILQPGDLTEHFPYPRMNFECLGKYIALFNKSNTALLTILGQHDQAFHRQSDNTPIAVMDKANTISLVSEWGEFKLGRGDTVSVYGCDFGKEIPNIKSPDRFNILLIHRMISNKDYWNGYVPYESPEWLLSKTSFDLIVSGDNHHSFQYFTSNSRGLINCGSLMRSNIDQADHKPCVWVFDTGTFSARQYNIPIKPFNEVFDLTTKEENKQTSMENEALIERLEKGFDSSGIDFVKNLRGEMVKEETNVQSIIEESMNG